MAASLATGALLATDGGCVAALGVGNDVRAWSSASSSDVATTLGSVDSEVTAVALDATGTRVASANGKTLTVWDARARAPLWSRTVTKRIAAIVFDGTSVVYADKFGDVCVLHGPAAAAAAPASEEAEREAAHERSLVLGHVSTITALMRAREGNRVVTADEDLRIRVAHWPYAFEIQAFCLGHTAPPRLLALEPSAHADSTHAPLLFSAADDGTVRAWRRETGELVCTRTPATDFAPALDAAAAPAASSADGASAGPRVTALCMHPARALLVLALADVPRLFLYEVDSAVGLRPRAGGRLAFGSGAADGPAPAPVIALDAPASGMASAMAGTDALWALHADGTVCECAFNGADAGDDGAFCCANRYASLPSGLA